MNLYIIFFLFYWLLLFGVFHFFFFSLIIWTGLAFLFFLNLKNDRIEVGSVNMKWNGRLNKDAERTYTTDYTQQHTAPQHGANETIHE